MSELIILEMKKVLDLQKQLHIQEGPPSLELRRDRISRCIAMIKKYQDDINNLSQMNVQKLALNYLECLNTHHYCFTFCSY